MGNVNYKNIFKVVGILGGISGAFYGIKKTVERFQKNKIYDKQESDDSKTVESKYDAEGFDNQGFSVDGYNRAGRDKNGYDREGYDIEGFERKGYDREGYRRNGFSREGYNREGFDRNGFARNGYNQLGLDRAEHNRQFYAAFLKKLRYRLDEAYQQLQQGQFRYALYDARIVMEETLKLVVQHTNGGDGIGDSILANIKICERKKLLGTDAELIDRLHEVRHICNFNGHEFAAEENMNHNKVYFVVMQTKDLLNLAEKILVCS